MNTNSRTIPKVDERLALMVYERPTLTVAGSFKDATAAGCTGPRDQLFNKQCV
jgi:hypothetical protein